MAKRLRRLRGVSMRAYLLLLVVSIVVPGGAFAAILFQRFYISEVQRVENDLQNDARQLALAVDRDLAGLQATLQTLATSNSLLRDDLEAFYRQAEQVRDYIGVNILLRDLDGQQRVNTRVPFGSALPRTEVEGDREVRDTLKPYVTGVLVGAVAQAPVYTVTVPVVRNGQLVYYLHLSLSPARLADFLKAAVESDRSAGIVDRRGLVLARTARFEETLGKPASPRFMNQMRGDEGSMHGDSAVTGEAISAAYARSKLAGWMVWVSVPDKEMRASLNNALLTLAALALALTLLATLIAYTVGNRIARSIRELSAAAAALDGGQPVRPKRLPVREVNQVGEELVAASERLQERAHERDRAEDELRRLSANLEQKVSERTRDLVEEMRRREQTEEMLRQTQKMEAIGQLTGGIAHDFNNMLAIILGSIDLALRRLGKGDTAIEKYLVAAQEGSQRAAALTQRLLAFSRQQSLAPEALDANRLVSGMSDLLRRSLGEPVQLETVLAGGLWRVHADANQLENAILNLAVNARDAMPEGGKLTIETANAYLDDAYAAEHNDVRAGQYVLVAVTDTGTGMPAEVAEKAFDPFFTTKGSGSGTGLGLSQVYGFVKQSGGHVKIYSEMGRGTTIKVYLPRYVGELPGRPEDADLSPLPTGGKDTTILVVEDEAGVRAHAVNALRELGYTVLDAAGPAAALALVEAHPEIALVLTDVVMPEMDGRRLSEEIRRRRPAVRVLFTTGYTRNAIFHNGMLDPGVSLLPKPFTLEQLARKVADLLRAPPAGDNSRETLPKS